ncbi:MAG: glutamate formimidoyltransferase [Bacteroidota bacterium]
MAQLIECVPNFSEGRDAEVLQHIAVAIRSVADVHLLHIDQGEAANRTVFTFVGSPEGVVEAAFQAIRVASSHIDMQIHQGTHPRIGAADVCPLVPLANITMEELIPYAKQLAQRVAEELTIPVYLYEAAAQKAHRRNLANIRKGEYEGLEQKMKRPEWQPDYGRNGFNARSGATVIGVRPFLIAYNINLGTKDVVLASKMAADLRESGKKIWIGETQTRISGRLKAVKAIGWFIEEYDCAQVSMNLVDFSVTGMHTTYETCKSLANQYGTNVTGSELIGLVPLQALLEAGRLYAPELSAEKDLVQTAVEKLGLSSLQAFIIEERIVEYCLARQK